jgi:hypothetical protein
MVIFADYSGDDGFSADDRGPARPGRTAFSMSGAAVAGIGAACAVVMDQGLAEHQDRVAVTEDQDPARQSAAGVPMTRSLTTFRLGVLGEVVMIRSPSALNTSPNVVTARAS